MLTAPPSPPPPPPQPTAARPPSPPTPPPPPQRVHVLHRLGQQIARHRLARRHARHPGEQRERDAIHLALPIQPAEAKSEGLRDALDVVGGRDGVIEAGAEQRRVPYDV